MRTLLLILLSLVYLSANGQTFEKKGRFVSDPLYDTIVTVFIGSDTTGGGGVGLISNADTSYVYATGDCLTILADTIRIDGYLDLPASISFDSVNIGTATYLRTTTGANKNNTGAIYRDSSNVLQVDRCLPWTCNDSGDVILTDTTDYVGIGTSSPSAALHVVGGVSLDSLNNKFRIGNDIGVDGFVDEGIAITSTFQDSIGLYIGSWYFEDEARHEVGIRADTLGRANFNKFLYLPETNSWDWTASNPITFTGSFNNFAITGQGEADGYVLTSDASGNATWQDHTAYGEMGFGDSTSTQALTQNVWHVVTNGNEDLWASAVVDTHAVTYSNDSLIIAKAGTYSVHAQLSVDGSILSIIRLGIYINGALACTCTGYQELTNNTVVQLNYINIDQLNEGDVLQVVITNTANNHDVDAIAGKLTIHKID